MDLNAPRTDLEGLIAAEGLRCEDLTPSTAFDLMTRHFLERFVEGDVLHVLWWVVGAGPEKRFEFRISHLFRTVDHGGYDELDISIDLGIVGNSCEGFREDAWCEDLEDMPSFRSGFQTSGCYRNWADHHPSRSTLEYNDYTFCNGVSDKWNRLQPCDWANLAREWLADSHRPSGEPISTTGLRVIHMGETASPENQWKFILSAVGQAESDADLCVIAAGPVEDLMSVVGEQFIERVEQRASTNPNFAQMLSGVWRSTIGEAVWKRLRAARAPLTEPDDPEEPMAGKV